MGADAKFLYPSLRATDVQLRRLNVEAAEEVSVSTELELVNI